MIPPALTKEEWRTAAVEGSWESGVGPLCIETEPQSLTICRTDGLPLQPAILQGDLHALIALANASLPDDDPRKITDKQVASLYLIIDAVEGVAHEGHVQRLRQLADILASYLPPREGTP